MNVNICRLVFGIALLFCAGLVFAQSETTENKPPAGGINAPDNSKKEIPTPKANYEFIAPRNIRDFMVALKEAGTRGFRLDKMTTMRSGYYESSKQKANATVLAGVVRFDGESRFDYNFFFAEGEDDPEATINNLAKEGWAFRDVISVAGTGDNDSLLIEDLFANRLRKFPTYGNIYVLERTDNKQTPRAYKLLKAGVGTGRSPSAKLQGMLDQSLKEGFVPVATYFSFNFKSLLTVDSFSGILVEKRDDVKNLDYKFVRGNRSSGLWEEIAVFSKEGFRIENMNTSSAILVREKEKIAPVSYLWLEADEKTFQTDLAAALAKNPMFLATGIYLQEMGEMNKNLLIFETGRAANDELKFVNIMPVIPKQFKKNPQEFLKTIDPPEIAFQKALDEGFAPRDVYYTKKEGLVMIFARAKRA